MAVQGHMLHGDCPQPSEPPRAGTLVVGVLRLSGDRAGLSECPAEKKCIFSN